MVIACGDEGKTMTAEAATGEDGCCTITVPVDSCRLRIAYADDTLWSEDVFLLPDEPTHLVLDLCDLAGQPTNDPNPVRVDGAKEGALLLASIGPDSDQAGSPPLGREWKIYYYINDHLGTPMAMIDEDSRDVWRADLLPFGEAVNETGPMANSFRFPGQYRDKETGLHYNWNRYYLSGTGRYLSPDPVGFLGGFNRFNYVGSNPIERYDPAALAGIAIEFGGSMGIGEYWHPETKSSHTASGVYLGAKPDGYAEIGGYSTKGDSKIGGFKLGAGATIVLYWEDADKFFRSDIETESITIGLVTQTWYYDECGEEIGRSFSLFGRGFGVSYDSGHQKSTYCQYSRCKLWLQTKFHASYYYLVQLYWAQVL